MGRKYIITVPTDTANSGNWNKVAGIKAIRALTQLGLKEAKDMIEEAVGRNVEMEVILPSSEAAGLLQDLEYSGVVVHPAGPAVRQLVLGSIREMAILATVSGEYGLASRINQFLDEENKRG